MAKKSDRQAADPRYRPFRIGAYAVYLVLVTLISVLVIVSVVKSVRAMTPGRRPASETTLTVRECLQKAETLFQQLEEERTRLTHALAASETDDAWVQFRVGWLEQFRNAEAQCAVQSRGREPLRQVFRRLDQVMDLYTTAAVQYAGEMGGAVDGLRSSLDAAKKDPSAGRLP